MFQRLVGVVLGAAMVFGWTRAEAQGFRKMSGENTSSP